jgi:hypothetical protein
MRLHSIGAALIALTSFSCMAEVVPAGVAAQLKSGHPEVSDRAFSGLQTSFEQGRSTLKAKTVVVGYAGHLDRKNMLLTVQVWRMPSRSGESPQRRQRDWLGLPFSYETMPSAVFHRVLPEVIDQLDLRAAKKRAVDRTAIFPVQLTQAPRQLIARPAKNWPVSSVALLVAALASNDVEHTRERLFERALLASMNLDARRPAAS